MPCSTKFHRHRGRAVPRPAWHRALRGHSLHLLHTLQLPRFTYVARATVTALLIGALLVLTSGTTTVRAAELAQTTTPPPPPQPGYTGEWTNSDGTVHLRARTYHPQLGRFLQRDTFPGFAAQPQSLNRYAYTENNPTNYVDPSGASRLPSFDDRIIVEEMGQGFHSSFHRLSDGSGMGVVNSRLTSSDLLQQADDLALLRRAGIPTVERCIGIYCGQPAWLVPPEQVGLVHSRDGAFTTPSELLRVAGPDRLEIALTDLRQAQLTVLDQQLYFGDVQGIIAPNGRFLFDDPSVGSVARGVNPDDARASIAQIDRIARSAENALGRTGRPVPPRPSRLPVRLGTGTYVDAVYGLRDLLNIERRSRQNRALCNQSLPRRVWGQLLEDIERWPCATTGMCAVPIES